MLTERLARILLEPASARALGDLLGDQRDRAIEADAIDVVAGLQARIGLVVFHERTEAADACGDRFTRLRVATDFTRQRQQLQRQLERHVTWRRILRNSGAPRL